MTALDRILPKPALLEHHHVDVAANPARVWQYVRHLELARSPIVRILFALRTLPDRIAGEHEPLHIRIDDLVSSPARPGFQILIDDPPHEVTVGAIGKVWRLAIPFVHVEGPDAFASFSEPGFVKVAWALRVIRRRRSGARVEIELRVAATDPRSWRLFKRYFRLIGPPSRFIRQAALARIARELSLQDDLDAPELIHLAKHLEGGLARDTAGDVAEGLSGAAVMTLALMTPFLRHVREHWGLEADDAARAYPGDDLVPGPRWLWTHAVEIDAPVQAVWPWVAQIGADRGGFYSYQWLENLAGCEIRNAETIHTDWELLAGDALVLHPGTPPLRVVGVDREHYVVAFGAPDTAAQTRGGSWASVSWLFLLEPLDADRCRLVSRFRSACSDDIATRLAHGPTIVEPIGFAMDRRMLLGVKARSERSWRSAVRSPDAFPDDAPLDVCSSSARVGRAWRRRADGDHVRSTRG